MKLFELVARLELLAPFCEFGLRIQLMLKIFVQ
jgi:hypothetical protein